MIATASAVAFVVYSCNRKLSEAERLDLSETPVQTVDSLFMIQTTNGSLKMRVEADVMERYETDTSSYELFPKGLHVFAYSEDDKLETVLHSNNAKHFKSKTVEMEYWSAFGNVTGQSRKSTPTAMSECSPQMISCRVMACVLTRWPGILCSTGPSTAMSMC